MTTPDQTNELCVKLFNGLWELYKMGEIYVYWLNADPDKRPDKRFFIIDKCANKLKHDDYNLYQAFVMAYDVIHPEK